MGSVQTNKEREGGNYEKRERSHVYYRHPARSSVRDTNVCVSQNILASKDRRCRQAGRQAGTNESLVEAARETETGVYRANKEGKGRKEARSRSRVTKQGISHGHPVVYHPVTRHRRLYSGVVYRSGWQRQHKNTRMNTYTDNSKSYREESREESVDCNPGSGIDLSVPGVTLDTI